MKPVPKVLRCPECSLKHVDRGIWATRPHTEHLCECGHLWTPFPYPTVGVETVVSSPREPSGFFRGARIRNH